MKKSLIPDVSCSLMVLLFSYASVTKFIDHRRFAFQLHLVPIEFIRTLAPLISWIVPGIELLLVLGLLINRYRRNALVASVILLCLFECYIGAMLLSGLDLPCTCGGVITRLSWKAHLLFNAVFITIGFIGIKYSQLPKKVNPTGPANHKDLSRA